MKDINKKYARLEEVSDIFDIPINTIRKLASKRVIPVYRPFGGRRLYVCVDELEEIFQKGKIPPGG